MQPGAWRVLPRRSGALTSPPAQFGGQEPGTDGEVATFCEKNYGVTFPLMAKSDVNGDNANEVFKYLKNQKSGLLGLTRIKVRRDLPSC